MHYKAQRIAVMLFFVIAAVIAEPQYGTPEFYMAKEWIVVVYIAFAAGLSMKYFDLIEKGDDGL